MSNMILLAVSGRRIIRIDEKEFPKTSGENSVVLNALRKIEHIEIKAKIQTGVRRFVPGSGT